MLGGNGYTCGICPQCGENVFWNDSRCMTCGYESESEEEDEKDV